MRLLVEHVRGHRRGERDVFDAPERVSFGRHPQNDVVLDPRADIDASSRHAEIRREGHAYVLRDVGSSNGTFADGQPVQELALTPGVAVVVDLGAGGPRIRLWLGDPDAAPGEAPSPTPRRLAVAAAAVAVAVAALTGLAVWLAIG